MILLKRNTEYRLYISDENLNFRGIANGYFPKSDLFLDDIVSRLEIDYNPHISHRIEHFYNTISIKQSFNPIKNHWSTYSKNNKIMCLFQCITIFFAVVIIVAFWKLCFVPMADIWYRYIKKNKYGYIMNPYRKKPI